MNNIYQQIIESLRIHPGPGGLSIPELSEAAADEEIAAAIHHLDNARISLRQKRALLRNNSAKLMEAFLKGA